MYPCIRVATGRSLRDEIRDVYMTKKIRGLRDFFTLSPTNSTAQPYVIEEAGLKALYFDSRSVQSRMRQDAPYELQFGYTRAMMGFLLFQPAPRDILVVGLGGGSLSKYCYHHLPEATVTTVEINPAVIALREEFVIPPDDERFTVIHADAADYMVGKTAIADIILLDGFEDYGLPPALSSPRFYGDCYSALRDGGVLAANLWGSDTTVHHCYRHIRTCFDQKMVQVRSETSTNVVAFAFKNPQLPPWATLQRQARAMQRETEINFPYVLDEMLNSARPTPHTPHWLTGR